MRHLGSALLAVSMLAGCGGVESEPPSESLESSSVERQQSPLTTTDVDVAPECQGIINFVNGASFQTLDAYLPSDVATNLIARRTVSPFVTLAEVSAVSGVGPARLEQLEGGARAQSYIGPSCVGIMDELAVSADDAAAIVSLVNSVPDSELHDILPDAWNGAASLLNLRPFSSAQAISNVAGIGEVSLRNIRNSATLSRPLEALIAAVNALPQPDYGAKMARHFDWWEVVTGRYYRTGGLECFGLEPSSVPYEATVRPYLANAAEVRAEVVSTVNTANRSNQLPSSVVSAGLANLDERIAGRAFKGCYFSYSNDPWSGHNIAIFVDTVNGFSVMTETYWSE
ncbi:helix-hairpin-helix domain-containing protein [Pyxidicoccus trucidator]|uniref:helix-hairpin-helix domain-containing protein n=1 Tax=Pyxidicoccus trucidator TaxID=2709662 RepID=UPI0013DA7EA1|nr:helix-hairpin-helix domain-containing protein [Pyxidicoccus trucidator]